MIMLLVEFEIDADKQAAFEAVITGLAADTLANEDGALLYQPASVDGAPGHYRLVEIYRDQDAVDVHMASDWFRKASAEMRPLLGKRPAIIRHTAIADSFAMKGT